MDEIKGSSIADLSDQERDLFERRDREETSNKYREYRVANHTTAIRSRAALMFAALGFCILVFIVTSRPFLYQIGLQGSVFLNLTEGPIGALLRIISVLISILSVLYYLIINYLQLGFFIGTKKNIKYIGDSFSSSFSDVPVNAAERNTAQSPTDGAVRRRAALIVKPL